jgi:hypothetical protein
MGIPSAFTFYLESLQGLVPAENILQGTRHHVVNARGAICRRRTLEKGESLSSLSVSDGLFKDLIFFPILKDRLSDMRVIDLFKFLVRFHKFLS